MSEMGPTFTDWHKATASSGNNDCVEVGRADARRGVRDSKDCDGAVLAFGEKAWASFLNGIRTGEFD